MNLNDVVDHELHACEPNAIGGQAPPAQRRSGIGEVEHDLGTSLWNLLRIERGDRELPYTAVDEALLPLGAGHGNLLASFQHLGGIAATDDGGQAEFSTHDRGVGCPASVIGNDSGGALHQGHPIWVRVARHEDGVFGEAFYLVGAIEPEYFAYGDGIANAITLRKQLALVLETVAPQATRLFARLHRLRTRLNDEQFAGYAILRPLHIHSATIVFLDAARPTRQLHYVLVVQHEVSLFFPSRSPSRYRARASLRVHDLLRLLAAALLDDGHETLSGEEGFVDHVFIGVDRALYHGLAQAPGRVDQHRIGEACFGVDGKHDSCPRLIRAHHRLHAHRQRYIHMLETVVLAIGDGTIGEQ